ncbi:ABC transporter permease [Listeria costaricensis]|uniref:ABC transporter permease n=1 Tax=Listeria costaricensis TaxID=2026604 RepID=UPI000C08ABA9|nr:ABC transporter permease [Listeria costaricensis]
MKQIGWLFHHHFTTLRSNKFKLITILFFPILSILIYFFAYDLQGDTSGASIRVANDDAGTYTTALVSMLEEKGIQSVSVEKGKQQLESSQIDALILLQKGSNQSLKEGTPAHFQIESMQGEDVVKTVKMTLQATIAQVEALLAAGGPDQFATYQASYLSAALPVENVSLNDKTDLAKMMSAQILGFLCMMLLYAAGNVGELILQEKEDRTYQRLMSTPLSANQYLIGSSLFGYLVVLFEVFVCLIAMKFIFQIDPGTSYLALFSIMSLFSLMAIFLSLAFGFAAKSRRSISALQMIIFTLSTLLSGALIPIAIMPDIMQKVAHFMPQYWVMHAISILQNGGGLAELFSSIAVLLGFTVLFASIAIFQYRKKEQETVFM